MLMRKGPWEEELAWILCHSGRQSFSNPEASFVLPLEEAEHLELGRGAHAPGGEMGNMALTPHLEEEALL